MALEAVCAVALAASTLAGAGGVPLLCGIVVLMSAALFSSIATYANGAIRAWRTNWP